LFATREKLWGIIGVDFAGWTPFLSRNQSTDMNQRSNFFLDLSTPVRRDAAPFLLTVHCWLSLSTDDEI